MNLVLDLDGTLINCNISDRKEVVIRPHLEMFLKRSFELFDNVAIFSAASKKSWIDPILAEHITPILPEDCKFSFVFSEEHCLFRFVKTGLMTEEIQPCKPLKQVAKQCPEFNLENTIILDDFVGNFLMNPKNGIFIPSFDGQEDDHYLLKFIQQIEECINENKFNSAESITSYVKL